MTSTVPRPIPLAPLPSSPLVSVIISNYNYGRFLPGAVESVRRQTYRRWEIVVCDDGSTDESRAVIEALAEYDPRIVALFKPNGGQSSAWNLACERSQGQIIAFLDPDDRFLPKKLAGVVESFQANSRVGVVYHRYQPASESGEDLGSPFPRSLESGWLADCALSRGGWNTSATVSSCLSIRREVAQEVFPLPLDFRTGVSDAYIQSVAQFLTEFQELSGVLTRYLVHGSNATAAASPREESIRSVLDLYEVGIPRVHEFVRAHFGNQFADQLRLDDVSSYWEYVAALYVLSGQPSSGVDGYRKDDISRHLPNSLRRWIWQALFTLPAPVSRYAFQTWWAQSWWKPHARRITGRLGIER